jgi:hypothetical protein
MVAIFNRQGKTIAWLKDKHIYDLSKEKVLAFIKGEALQFPRSTSRKIYQGVFSR